MTTDNFTDLVVPVDWNPDSSLIKVVGVGGGGCNAVTYMYNQKIQGCTFIICNTDSQTLRTSSVPVKIQLGKGRGAGTDPIVGRNAALDSTKEIEETIFGTATDILFVTAGMGGGTGTGAAPVIANMAKKQNILTIGVVTIPFENEGNEAMSKALEGVKELEKNVDSLLIIQNEKLYECYPKLLAHEAFPKVDEVLATAIRGITEIVNIPGHINVDMEDIQKMMRGSGMALMGCGVGSGKNRLEDAVRMAMEYPLLNDYDLTTAKNVLLNITAGKNENGLLMEEFRSISEMVGEYTGNANNFKRGIVWDTDPDAGDKVKITVIVTGFKMSNIFGARENYGNFIMIGENFEHKSPRKDGEIELSEPPESIKVGYNTAANTRKFHFSDESRPALIFEHGEDRSEAVNVPAIRRKSPNIENKN